MSKEEIAERAGLTLDAWEQGEPIDEISFADDIRNLIAFAIANKATEEDELPDFPKPVLFTKQGTPAFSVAQLMGYVREAIAADRASRQGSSVPDCFANKAEADLSMQEVADTIGAANLMRPDEFRRFLNGDDVVMSATQVWMMCREFAAPSVTTGASTVPSIAGQDFEFLLGAYMLAMESGATRRHCADCKKALVDYIDRFVATNGKAVGASTVLTDERIEAIWCREAGEAEAGKRRIAFARAIEREVAAQAGQVAVPEDALRVVRRLLDGSQPQDVPGALMVIDTALAGGAA